MLVNNDIIRVNDKSLLNFAVKILRMNTDLFYRQVL